MNYAVLLTTRAARELGALPKEVVARVDPRLTDLGTDPRPPGCKKLKLAKGTAGESEWVTIAFCIALMIPRGACRSTGLGTGATCTNDGLVRRNRL